MAAHAFTASASGSDFIPYRLKPRPIARLLSSAPTTRPVVAQRPALPTDALKKSLRENIAHLRERCVSSPRATASNRETDSGRAPSRMSKSFFQSHYFALTKYG